MASTRVDTQLAICPIYSSILSPYVYAFNPAAPYFFCCFRSSMDALTGRFIFALSLPDDVLRARYMISLSSLSSPDSSPTDIELTLSSIYISICLTLWKGRRTIGITVGIFCIFQSVKHTLNGHSSSVWTILCILKVINLYSTRHQSIFTICSSSSNFQDIVYIYIAQIWRSCTRLLLSLILFSFAPTIGCQNSGGGSGIC